MTIALPLGFGLALVGSMPMGGPVAVLFMTRALKGERGAAFLIALGGSLVEAGYALAVAYFLPNLVGRTRGLLLGSLALGCLVVSAMGTVLIVRPDVIQGTTRTPKKHGFGRGALSSLLNPTLIATWTVAVSTLYANGWLSGRFTSALSFAVGVCLGSLAWFGAVLAATAALHRRVTPKLQTKILRSMGGVLLLSGALLGVRFVTQLSSPNKPSSQRSLVRAGRLLTRAAESRDKN